MTALYTIAVGALAEAPPGAVTTELDKVLGIIAWLVTAMRRGGPDDRGLPDGARRQVR